MKKIISAVLLLAVLAGCLSAVAVSADGAGLTPVKDAAIEGLTLDREAGLVLGIPGNPTAAELKALFENSADITVSVEDGKKVPTGATVSAGDDSLAAIIYGDVNCDAKINVSDATTLLKKLAKWDVACNEIAADVNADGKVNVSDVTTLLKYIAKWHVFLGGVGMTVIEEKQTAVKEDKTMELIFGNGVDKYTKKQTEFGDKVTDVIYAAKDEAEQTQFVLTASEARNDLTVKFTPFTKANGAKVKTELFYEHFYDVINPTTKATVVSVADALVPTLTGLNIAAGKFMPFCLKATTDKDTAPGLYESEITVLSGKDEIKRAYAYLYVWDFILPPTKCASSMGLSRLNVVTTYKFNGEGQEVKDAISEVFAKYYNELLENRLCSVILPYDVDDERAQAYINDPRVTAFLVGGVGYGGDYERSDDQVRAAYETLKDNPDAMKKGYFYLNDEPGPDGTSPEKGTLYQQFKSIETNYKHAHDIFPGAQVMIPNHFNQPFDTAASVKNTEYTAGGHDGDIIEVVIKNSDIFCPHTWLFTDPYSTNPLAQCHYDYFKVNTVERFGTLRSRYDADIAEHPEKSLWWYTSDNPRDGYCNIYASKPGYENRELFWQQYLYDTDGFLYWAVSDWSLVQRKNSAIVDEFGGLLIYPGTLWNLGETPIESIRLDIVRDGIEDFDYLKLIEEKYGKDTADEFVKKITTDLLEYNTDGDYLISVRKEMGELLAK